MGNLSGESCEQNRTDKVTRFCSVTYARQLGSLVNTLGSHLKRMYGKQLPPAGFWIFIFTVRLGNPKKDLKNCP